MYDINDGEGTCEAPNCNKPAVVNLSGVNLCPQHSAQEFGMTEKEAQQYLRQIVRVSEIFHGQKG